VNNAQTLKIPVTAKLVTDEEITAKSPKLKVPQ